MAERLVAADASPLIGLDAARALNLLRTCGYQGVDFR